MLSDEELNELTQPVRLERREGPRREELIVTFVGETPLEVNGMGIEEWRKQNICSLRGMEKIYKVWQF